MRGSLKKLALTFCVLALLAVSAGAQCGGKQVYLQLPSSGWNKTAINILWEGGVTPATASVQGDFSVFTFPSGLGNDAASHVFAFSMKSTDIDNGNQWIASGARYDITGARPTDGQRISCNVFGSGNIVYIYPSPTNPGTTLTTTQPPNAYNFYFLPPGDNDWTLGIPVFVYSENGSLKRERLNLAPGLCGWYKKTYFNATPPNAPSLIWLNGLKDGTLPDDQIGRLGLDEDPMDWVDNMPTPFNLVDEFGGGPGDLYFAPSKGGWTRTHPGVDGVCSYTFAAIIYDTDKSVNTSFLQDCNNDHPDYAPEFGACTSNNPPGVGIVKGIPKDRLTLVDGVPKMEWANKGGNIDYWTETNFNDAFKPTKGKNVVRCYDMPFKRNAEGLWEFNSNKLCKNNSMDLSGDCGGGNTGNPGYMGGFFPPELQTRGDADYSDCSSCDKTWHTQGWVPLEKGKATSVSQFCYDRGKRSGTSEDNLASCGPDFGAGDLRDGDNPAIWDWAATRLDSRAESSSLRIPAKNAHYCFESSPATFIYEPGQKFFFSGDDDIWVFINNRLAIDLGGTHLAAPGYVDLDAEKTKLGLEEGGEYNMNIFFCDRRTTMSNVRITTNMYFAQKNLLELTDKDKLTGDGAKICLATSGSDGTCGSASNSSGPSTQCGSEISSMLDYYMLNRRGDTLWLNTAKNSDNCKVNGDDLVCYGGVTLKGGSSKVNTVQVRNGNIGGLQGTYRVFAKINESNSARFQGADPVEITRFTASATVKAVWGKIYRDDNGKLIFDLGDRDKSTVSGKPVPIGFAAGNWRCEDASRYGKDGCEFDVYMESSAIGGSRGQQVTITQSADPSGSTLLFYENPLGEGDGVSATKTFTIPSVDGDNTYDGLLVVWVTGAYRAASDVQYRLNASGVTSEDLGVKVYLPRLKFIDPDELPTVTRLNKTVGSDPTLNPLPEGCTDRNNPRCLSVYVGTPLERAVAAYDISGGSLELCTTCKFALTVTAWAEQRGNDLNNNPNFGTDQSLMFLPVGVEVENGIAEFSVSGKKLVVGDTFAFFTVRGPSQNPETIVQWDSLQFDVPDVPYPILTEIFDRNGDGRGDSLRVAYSWPFNRDSLPSMLVVNWDPDEPLYFGIGKKVENDQFSGDGMNPQDNRDYWNNQSRSEFKTRLENDSVLVIYYDISDDREAQADMKAFSEKIKTSSVAGKDEVVSWASFKDSKKGNRETHFSPHSDIGDKIPAIVIKAAYKGDERKCGTLVAKCEDVVTLTLSEPVKEVEGISNEAKNAPFAYRLASGRSRPQATTQQPDGSYDRFNYYQEPKNLADRLLWDRNAKDSLVRIYYWSYKDESGDTTQTPIAGDSVRFVWNKLPGGGYVALTDLVGNEPNEYEYGRRIEGRNRSNVDEIYIAELDPDGKILKDALDRVRDEHGLLKGVDSTNGLFNQEKPIVFLPGLEGWDATDIKNKYPGSVGQLFEVDVNNNVSDLEEKYGVSIPSENITFHAQAFYHTNLGNFVVESKPIEIKCNDKIFQINGSGDCRSGGAKSVYLAWNLRDSKNRLVGTGAYVEVYDFHWAVNYNTIHETFNKAQKKIEMKGVKRGKKR